MNRYKLLTAELVTGLIIGLVMVLDPGPIAGQARAALPDPVLQVIFPTPSAEAVLPTVTPEPIRIGGDVFGWPGQVQCWDCNPFQARVRLTNYDPNAGPINCWDFDEELSYCMSDTASGIPWESVYGFSAACPIEWPYGTWVDVKDVGQFICLDRGNLVVCDDQQLCAVDILGPSGAWWNGKTFEATLWVPLRPRKQ